MSAVRNTPGPWRAEANSDDAMVFAGEETLVADLYPAFAQGEPIDDENERAANAKLIAAAPALAEALEAFLDMPCGCSLAEVESGHTGDCSAPGLRNDATAALRAAGRLP